MRSRRSRFIIALLVAAAAVAGCDRGGKSSARPTTRPVAAPEGLASGSVLSISGRSYTFSPARMTVDVPASGEPGVFVQVFSEGASPEGARDGYYLEMTVDVPDSSQLDGASWDYANDSNERADDTLSAITVNGGANQLQPKDVTVTFRRVSADVFEVRLNGFFNVFGKRDRSVSSGVVPVEATLVAKRQAAR